MSLFNKQEWRFDPILLWTPVIELDFGQERFLIENPVESVLKGDFVKVPVIGGLPEFDFAAPAFGKTINKSNLSYLPLFQLSIYYV